VGVPPVAALAMVAAARRATNATRQTVSGFTRQVSGQSPRDRDRPNGYALTASGGSPIRRMDGQLHFPFQPDALG
jgi:hypothetical protein